jgi:hypothetical protein
MKTIVYTATFGRVNAPLALYNNTFTVSNNGLAFLLKSINFDMLLVEQDATGNDCAILPLEANTTQLFGLYMYGQVGTDVIARPYADVLPPGSVTLNGNQLSITKPCQLFFESFYLQHIANFTLQVKNYDLITSYRWQSNISIEIEEYEKR